MKRKILVVDDDPVLRHWLVKTLESFGHSIVQGEDGQQALALVRDESPDLVLIDVEMPGMGGREVCRILKANKNFGFVPVILMTAREDVQGKIEGLGIGADDYLVKPLNPLELEARVKSMLRLKILQDELMQANNRLKSMNEHLQDLSTTDALMGINNRMFFNKRIDYEFQRAQRYRKDLTLLVLDLDHFKSVNDTYGHPFGDRVLKGIADVLLTCVRQVDIVARYGGEELVVALPETNLEQAMIVAERIRSSVEETEIADGDARVKVTVSIGMATFPHDSIAQVEQLLKRADDALYAAKQAGRNCIRCDSAA